MRALLSALQHGDSAFPSGGFAFSNGIEAAGAEGAPLDKAGLLALIEQTLRHRWAEADRVALAHSHRTAAAGRDEDALAAIDAGFEAASLCEPLRIGSRKNGAAFLAAHSRLGTPGAAELARTVRDGRLFGHLPVMQGVIWQRLGLDETMALALSAYGAASMTTTTAIRLGRIGALAAQPVLTAALDLAAELSALPVRDDQPIAACLPFIEIASARQVDGDLRLFAS